MQLLCENMVLAHEICCKTWFIESVTDFGNSVLVALRILGESLH